MHRLFTRNQHAKSDCAGHSKCQTGDVREAIICLLSSNLSVGGFLPIYIFRNCSLWIIPFVPLRIPKTLFIACCE